jgi:hypothetical protein
MQGCGARRDSTIRANSLRSKCRFRDLSPAIGTKQNVLTVSVTVKLNLRSGRYPLRRPAVLKTCVRAPEGWAVIRSELTSRTVTANFSSNPWPRFGAGTWKTGAWRHIYC